tara:strand:+ start:652 stop:1650 length:999 start_codon:yes stop_codon:yes gene_type:complete
MFKNLDPQDISKKSFQTFKNFTFNNNDSGSGVFAVKARSGSLFNYVSASDDIIGVTSGSITTNYFSLPNWHMLNNTFYSSHGKVYANPERTNRQLHLSASVISVGRDLFGEQIKPGSIQLSDTSLSATRDIRDDGEGNLYDNAFSASFAAFKSGSKVNAVTPFTITGSSTRGSGSVVGNVFYEQGLLVFTDTGSYRETGHGTGYTLKYQATQTHYEYEYRVRIKPLEFNTTTNISTTPDRSGSISVAEGVVSMSNFFPPSHNPSGEGTGSYATFYNAVTESLSFTQNSEFRPYVTEIGLYSENSELLVHGKLAKPIKLSDDIETTFIVRFDV